MTTVFEETAAKIESEKHSQKVAFMEIAAKADARMAKLEQRVSELEQLIPNPNRAKLGVRKVPKKKRQG
jgi:uncharacterized protein YceH (UPF0502 family)